GAFHTGLQTDRVCHCRRLWWPGWWLAWCVPALYAPRCLCARHLGATGYPDGDGWSRYLAGPAAGCDHLVVSVWGLAAGGQHWRLLETDTGHCVRGAGYGVPPRRGRWGA